MNSEERKYDLIKFLNEIMPKGFVFKEDQLGQISEFTSQISKEILSKDKSQKNSRMANEFIQIAEQDIKDAQLLYENKSFASSIYYLQQSVEKAVKAYLLASYIFNEEENDFQKIKHKTPEAFVKLLEKKYVAPYLELMKSFYPELIKGNAQELERLINNKPLEIAKFNKNQIEKILELSNKYIELSDNKEKNDKLNIVKESFLNWWYSESLSLLDDEESKEKLKDIKSRLSKLKFSCIVGVINLFILSLITYPHESYTRYPDQEMTPKDYTPDLGIVVMFNEITNILNSSIKALKEYLELMKNV